MIRKGWLMKVHLRPWAAASSPVQWVVEICSFRGGRSDGDLGPVVSGGRVMTGFATFGLYLM